MDPTTVLLISLGVLMLLLLVETPVGVALGASGVVGLVLLRDFSYALNVLGSAPFTSTSTYSLVIIPMFILMGMFAVRGRIAEQVYAISSAAFRRLPGALACATVAACAGFAAVTGSSVATAATMARLSIDEMIKYGYAPHFAAGTVAASGTLGVMIPPSLILVIYAILTGESVGQMLVAGIIPGLLSAASYIAYILMAGPRHIDEKVQAEAIASLTGGSSALPSGEADDSAADDSANPHRPSASGVTTRPAPSRQRSPVGTTAPAVAHQRLPYRGLFRIALLFAIIMGGVYSGVFTATESGALGALAAVMIMVIELRHEPIRRIARAFAQAAAEMAQTTSMIFLIVVGSAIFSAFLVSSRIPNRLATSVAALDVPPLVIVLIMFALLIPLGMALESISILIITMPLLYPIATQLGFDGVWFGIITVKMIELGLITPPVGIAVYVVAGSVPGVKVEQVFRGVVPFILLDIALIATLIAFPDLVTWLPSTAK